MACARGGGHLKRTLQESEVLGVAGWEGQEMKGNSGYQDAGLAATITLAFSAALSTYMGTGRK